MPDTVFEASLPNAIGAATTARPSVADKPLRLLTYVHLRNIHNSTGAGRVARQLTEHLARRSDVDLQVLCDARDRAKIVPLVGEPWTGFTFHEFHADTSAQQLKWIATGRPRAEDYWDQAEVVFCTGESYVPTRRARLAVTVHDAAFFESTAHHRDRAFWLQQMRWRVLFSRLERRADMIHTVSEYSASRIAHFFPSLSTRLRVVPNGVAPIFFRRTTSAGQEFLASRELQARPYILIPGGLHFRKNAALVLEVLPRLLAAEAGVQVVIVNHSDPEYARKASSLSDSVHVLGFVTDEALHALYAEAAVVWFPSRYEGFGLPVVESMASGAPVVASDASSLPEIAGDAALLASPESAQAHLDAVLDVLRDRTLADRLRELGRERARGFTWESSASKLAGHLRELRG